MAILNNSNAISSGGYDINNSLRFRASASAYLNRTPASAGNRQKFTLSVWIKLGTLGTNRILLSSNTTAQQFRIYTDNTIGFGNSGVANYQSTGVLRDPSAWYHIVCKVDTTLSSGKVIIYVNNQTYLTTDGGLSLNANTQFNNTVAHFIGRDTESPNQMFFDGYMAEYNFIDGQALTPSSFGETSTTTGSWIPKAYTGTYGTNGFYLKFSDIATTSGSNAGLGKDFSGNGNYWTTNNISVTAGVTYDAMIDSPTLTSATVANYCTLNPLRNTSSAVGTFSNANLKISGTTGTINATAAGTMAFSGKMYCEMTIEVRGNNTTTQGVGIVPISSDQSNRAGLQSTGIYYLVDGNKRVTGTSSAYGSSYTSGDVIGIAVDTSAETVTFYKNNVSQGSISGTGVISAQVFPYIGFEDSGSPEITANFGQRPFAYTPPTGFVRMNTFNLTDSTIVKGNLYMDSTLWTGNGTSQTIVNAGAFRPDFVWIKCRTVTEQHQAMDSVRGASKVLNPNQTVAETTDTTKLTAFNSNGFSVGSELAVNTNGATYVGWQWQAGQGSTSSNTSGTIASTVSVNTTAGFSIATYTGNGTGGATVGHGLGVAPKFIIVKTRSNIDNWPVGTAALGWDRHTLLNLTSATAVTSSTWNDTAPTPTVFSIGTDSRVNNSGWTYVAYCWAEIAGFSKFGSYTGNGSADGPFVYTGFRPEWLLVKQSSSAGNNWQLLDTARNTFNKADKVLFPSSSAVEGTGNATFDFLSNGVKIRAADGTINTSSSTYIYMAFAENPFKNANAR